MKFIDTRDKSKLYSLKEVATMGLAPSGGLFMPESIPTIDMEKVLSLADESFPKMAHYVAKQFFDDLDDQTLAKVIDDAYDFPVTMTSFGALELFNGPTMAFKDFGARFMARMLSVLLDKDITILTATSGDTGSAVANGFHNIKGVKVIVLYPYGRVSDFQERQMTTLGGNISAIAIDGSFDDCQALCKEVLGNREYCEEKGITSANSISILRWIPQSFYYFYAYYLYKKSGGVKDPLVVTPSGNFGNITAGILAKKMGLPINRFIAATNANDTIVKYLETGVYEGKASVQTLSNAMDVGNPSNYERLIEFFDKDVDEVRRLVSAKSYSDADTITAIQTLFKEYNYISDPHSAIGYAAFKEAGEEGFYLSTAHYYKFKDVIQQALDVRIALPVKFISLNIKEKIYTQMKPDIDLLYKFIEA